MKAKAKAKEAARGSGSNLRDMGSIMAVLMPSLPPKRYDEIDVYNACVKDNHEELEKMIKQLPRLDVNWATPDTGGTAAKVAAQKGHDRCLSLLSKVRGVDLSKANKAGWAPIHAACQNGRHVCIDIILDNGVDANLRTTDEIGYTPAIICCMNGHVKSLAILCDRGADLNLANKNGCTAAHYACSDGYVKCLQLLGKRGADLSKQSVDGQTPLDYARRCKQAECIDLLLANGAIGMSVEDLRPVPEAEKVCIYMAASLSALSEAVSVFSRLTLSRVIINHFTERE